MYNYLNNELMDCNGVIIFIYVHAYANINNIGNIFYLGVLYFCLDLKRSRYVFCICDNYCVTLSVSVISEWDRHKNDRNISSLASAHYVPFTSHILACRVTIFTRNLKHHRCK